VACPVAIAIAAHPDDIEFYMAGTLLLLRRAGWEIHCFNLGSGNLGSKSASGKQTATRRRREAQEAARLLGAVWHPPICRDLEIFYDDRSLRRVASVIRQARPSIVLTHSPQDYMEDHMNTSRLAVSAAFARGMPNYHSLPRQPPVELDVTVYHGMPHLLRDPLGQPIRPGLFVNIGSVLDEKRHALAAHRSQKEWLDTSQGMDSYLQSMVTLSREVGRLSKKFRFAEGWRKHLHVGFCGPQDDPLKRVLRDKCLQNRRVKQ
jgi:LmbE family N-acetylglucosaminyl deacetylase